MSARSSGSRRPKRRGSCYPDRVKLVLTLPLIVALIGLVVYAVSTNGKAAEIGRIGFFCGLLAFLFGLR